MRKGFALILVLLFTAIILILITLISTSLVGGIKLNRQSQNTYEAYNMARDAITDAVTVLRNPYNLATNTTGGDKHKILPTAATSCDLLNGDYYFSVEGSNNHPVQSLTSSLPGVFASSGKYYAYQLCADGSNNYIEGRGYSGGQQIVLKAKITLKDIYTTTYTYPDNSTTQCGTASPLSPCGSIPTGATPSTVYNHANDLIHIYQVGP